MTRLPGAVFAHGVGGRSDLPLPFAAVLVGSALAVVASFAVVGVLRRAAPHAEAAPSGRWLLPRPLATGVDHPAAAVCVRLLGIIFFAVLVVALLWGRDTADNPAPHLVYVLLWVGVPTASVLLGGVYRWLDPLRTVHDLARGLRARGGGGLTSRYPGWLGLWPAAAGLLVFAWLELVAPAGASIPVLRLALAAYVAVTTVGALLYGSHWFDNADPFEVFSGLAGRICPLGRRPDGALVLRTPVHGVTTGGVRRGLAAVVLVLLGSTAFDGVASSVPYDRWARSTGAPRVLLDTGALLAAVAVFAAAYLLACWAGGRPSTGRRRDVPTLLAPSLVPIVAGYFVAHYFSLLAFEGPTALVLASDPLVSGSDPLGLAGWRVDYGWLSPSVVANVQTAALVLGPVVAVVAAHEQALRIYAGRPVTRQAPLLLLMVGYTVGGLLLLFQD